MDFIKNIFTSDGDEILFFILIFLFLFNGNTLNNRTDDSDDRGESTEGGTILFFIILFLMLFISNSYSDNTK